MPKHIDPPPPTRVQPARRTSARSNPAPPPPSTKKGKLRLPPEPSPPPPPPPSKKKRTNRALPEPEPLPPPPDPLSRRQRDQPPRPRPINPRAKEKMEERHRTKEGVAAKKAKDAAQTRRSREAMEAAVAHRRAEEAEELRRKEEAIAGFLVDLRGSNSAATAHSVRSYSSIPQAMDEDEEEDGGDGRDGWDWEEVDSAAGGVGDEDLARLQPLAVGEESDDDIQFVEQEPRRIPIVEHQSKRIPIDEQAAHAARTDDFVLRELGRFQTAQNKKNTTSSHRAYAPPAVPAVRTWEIDAEEDEDEPPEPDFDIPFKVPYGTGAVRDLKLSSSISWHSARVKIAEKMVRDASLLCLVYTPSWELKNGQKPTPTSLEDEEEWASLISHVRGHINEERARNRGAGSVRSFHVVLEDTIGAHPPPVPAARAPSSSKATSTLLSSSMELEVDGAPDLLKDRKLGELVAILKKHHHCEACKKACVILWDGKHRPLTMKVLSKWATAISLQLPSGSSIEKFPEILQQDLKDSSDVLHAASSGPAATEGRTDMTPAASAGSAPAGSSRVESQINNPGHANSFSTAGDALPILSTPPSISQTVATAALSGAPLAHAAALASYFQATGLLPSVYPQPQAGIPGTYGTGILPGLFPTPAPVASFSPGMPYNSYPSGGGAMYPLPVVAPPAYHGSFPAHPPIPNMYPSVPSSLPPTHPAPHTPRRPHYHSNYSRYYSDRSPTPHRRRSQRSEYYDGSPTSMRSHRPSTGERPPMRYAPYPPPRSRTPETLMIPRARSPSPMPTYSRHAEAYTRSPGHTSYYSYSPRELSPIPPPSPLRTNPSIHSAVNYPTYPDNHDYDDATY